MHSLQVLAFRLRDDSPKIVAIQKGTIVKTYSITSEKKLPSKKLFITKQGLISGMSSSSFGKK